MDPALAEWIPLVQIATNATLTIVGICIAGVSLFVAYRNNFGWKPIALVTAHGLRMKDPQQIVYTAFVQYEVWNRRKYPVIVRGAEVRFDGLKIEGHHPGYQYDKAWHIAGGERIISRGSVTLAPSSHQSFEASAPFKQRTLDDLRATIRIEVKYYDPRSNKIGIINISQPYQFT